MAPGSPLRSRLSPTKKAPQEDNNGDVTASRLQLWPGNGAGEMEVENGGAAATRFAQGSTARLQLRTPEPQTTAPFGNGHGLSQVTVDVDDNDPQRSPSTPGHIPPFDWEEFETRYEQALADLNGEEKELLEEFDRLVNYFNVWALAATVHDDERAVKRLQTRERYVKIAEQSLAQRKQHLTEVVRAFQSALALLSQQ